MFGLAPCCRSSSMQSGFPDPAASYRTVSPFLAWAFTSPPSGVRRQYNMTKSRRYQVVSPIKQRTMLYKYIQRLSVAICSRNAQRCDPMTVLCTHFSSMSEQQHQNVGAPHLVERQEGAIACEKVMVGGSSQFSSPLQLRGWPSTW